MDRILVQPSEIPTDTMFLATNKNAMVALAYLTQAVMGNSTAVDGFNCTATGPASLSVLLSTGSIYSLQNVDSVAYLTQGTDTGDQILKQGIVRGNTTLSCPAPSTSGQSINYLIQVAFSETDTNAQNTQFYNVSNPASPLTVNINTLRKSSAILSAKAGAAATTGTQATPAPDAGYTGLYVVTVANGQTTITSGNITLLTTAPFISTKLPAIMAAVQAGTANFATDSSGAANTITIALNPAVASLTNGMRVFVKVANTNSGNVVINTNTLGNVAAVLPNGDNIPSGGTVANGIYCFVYDGNGTRWILQNPPSNAVNGVSAQVFTSSGTYTPHAGLVYAEVEVQGGGGGSGGCASGTGTQGAGSAGGGGGGYTRKLITSSAIGSSQTVTVGAGGTAGTSGNNSGGAGGTSSFGAILSATGGNFSTGCATSSTITSSGSASGGGGSGSGGDINLTGGNGGLGVCYGGSSYGTGGSGGESELGTGGLGGFGNNNAGQGGLNYGGGAGGSATNTTAVGGSAGAQGVVIVTEYWSA